MALLDLDKRTAAWLVGLVLIGLYVRSLAAPKITRDGHALRTPPNTLPLVGNGILFLQARQKLFAWFARIERLHGYETLRIAVPSLPPGVIVSDPRNLDFVLRHEGVFEKGEFFKARSRDLFGAGIINADGEAWRAQRRAGLHFLNAANLKVLTDVALPRFLGQAVGYLGERADGKTVVDLQGVLHEVTTQLMGRMAYNMDMHADDDFTLAFEHASGATAERFQNPLWFITELLTGSLLRRSLAVVRSHGRRIVASAVADRSAAKDGKQEESGGAGLDGTSGSLIQSLLDAIGKEELVADAALNYLSAGKDTVAQALTWTFYLLMRHPGVLAHLREAVHRVHDPDAGTEHLTPTSLPYALAVFYESLRLYPPVPFEIKQAQQATVLPDGTALPAGAVVVWCAWAMNRSATTWGPDADAFRPERWLEEDDAVDSPDGRFVPRSAAQFPVFNGGPRLCLGKRMAELVAVQVVAALADSFEFRPAFEGGRVSRSSLTLPMEGGLPVYVTRREKTPV